MMARPVRALAVIAFLQVASCRGAPLPATLPVHDEAARRLLVSELLPPPIRARMVQRWVLAERHGEHFFTLYVRLDPPGRISMAALSDLGGTLAAGTWTDGVTAIDQESPIFPARLAKEILAALALVFLPGGQAAYELVRFDDGAHGLLRSQEGAHVLRWRERTGGAARVAAGRERIRCAVTITAWGGDDPRYPASLRIEDQAGFEATVDVVRFEPVAGGGADGAGG